MVDGNQELVDSYFAALYNLPVWGIENTHGSALILNFGAPTLEIREPILNAEKNVVSNSILTRRRVSVVGEFTILIEMCDWVLSKDNYDLATSSSQKEEMHTALAELNGQKLVSFEMNCSHRSSNFNFDLKACLKTQGGAYEDTSLQWTAYRKSKAIFSYLNNGELEYDFR